VVGREGKREQGGSQKSDEIFLGDSEERKRRREQE
jgi:hypothetical protein